VDVRGDYRHPAFDADALLAGALADAYRQITVLQDEARAGRRPACGFEDLRLYREIGRPSGERLIQEDAADDDLRESARAAGSHACGRAMIFGLWLEGCLPHRRLCVYRFRNPCRVPDRKLPRSAG
jgi:hypothetical protein